jgi:hypothetical protein
MDVMMPRPAPRSGQIIPMFAHANKVDAKALKELGTDQALSKRFQFNQLQFALGSVTTSC